MINSRKLLITGFLFLITFNGLFAAAEDQQATRRFGIFIGSNNGGRGRATLRYAISDARSVSRIFTQMGGIAQNDSILLVEPTIADINRQLDNFGRLSAQSRRNSQRTELVFYYSGHSDENGILLNRERYDYRELRERIDSVQADMKIVILDSCSSGAITRAKGGEKTQPFLFDSSVSTTGYAFLTSSSADETSQESDRIESSYFTHSILAGLRGAADSIGDGRVTLNELYRYAYTETLANTETSVFGAQHPSFDIQISGSGDVVLTDIKETSASLLLSEELTGRISIRDSSDFLIAELTKVSRRPLELGLEPGAYRITLQRGDNFYRAEIFLYENQRTNLNMGNFQVIAAASGNRNRGDDTPETASDEILYPISIQFVPHIGLFANNKKNTTNNLLVGIVAASGHNLKGIGAASIGLINTGNINGIQASGIFNIATGNVQSIQAAGIGNYAGGSVRGIQAAGIYNYAEEINGIQAAGIVNINRGGRGAMFGLVNISESENVIPFGLVNLVKNGIFHPAIYVDDMLFTNFSLRSGSKYFYALLSAGVGGLYLYERAEDTYYVTRAGLGIEIPINKFFINIDISLGTIHYWNESGISSDDSEDSFYEFTLYGRNYSYSRPYQSNVLQLRFTTGYKIFKHLGVFGGISFDYFYKYREKSPDPRNFGGAFAGGAHDNHIYKMGFFGGVQY